LFNLLKYFFISHSSPPLFCREVGVFFVLFLFAGTLFAQEEVKIENLAAPEHASAGERPTMIYLEKSESIQFDQKRLPDAQIIKGNPVRFRHDNAIMYCDSAYLHSKENSFDAFGNIRIIEGDSIFIYGDLLFYNGNTKLAKLRHNVRMENNDAVLTTDSLNYDREKDLAYYYTGGKLEDSQNTLTSVWGQYSPNTKQALFKNNVHLLNESFTMDSDTLKYNTETKVADIVGYTHIIYNDETNIYSTKGWYDTDNEQSMLLDRSLIVHADGKNVTGDTLFYNKKQQFVEGFMRVEMNDTVQQTTLLGNYVFYDELKEFGLATDSALLIDWSSTDSLFLHADTLYVSKDSIYDVVRAFYNVRFYRVDLQGACDSLVYLSKDSVGMMYGEPVIWSGSNQVSGEMINGYIKNRAIDYIHIPRGALAIQKVDSIYYNQLSGKELTAFICDGELKRVEMSGNAETLYYPVDEKDSVVIGINKTQSSYVNIYFNEQKLERIVLTAASTGVMYPLGELSGNELFLNGFFWLEDQQPRKKEDVFLLYPHNRHSSSIVHIRSAAAIASPNPTSEEGDATQQSLNRNQRPAQRR